MVRKSQGQASSFFQIVPLKIDVIFCFALDLTTDLSIFLPTLLSLLNNVSKSTTNKLAQATKMYLRIVVRL